MSRDVYRLHDSAIMGIVRALQEGLLTGTDVSDHLRMMRLEPKRDDPTCLELTDEYLAQAAENLERLAREADEARQAMADVPGALPKESVVAEVPEGLVVAVDGSPLTGDGDDHGPS